MKKFIRHAGSIQSFYSIGGSVECAAQSADSAALSVDSA